MYIQSFKIKNYMGFRETQELLFSPDMNLIVGQNNVGKSGLLGSLRLNFIGRPTRSLETIPTPSSVINPISEAFTVLGTSGREIKELLLSQGGRFYIPLDPNYVPNPPRGLGTSRR